MIIVKNVYLYNDISLVNQSSLGFFSGGSFFLRISGISTTLCSIFTEVNI